MVMVLVIVSVMVLVVVSVTVMVMVFVAVTVSPMVAVMVIVSVVVMVSVVLVSPVVAATSSLSLPHPCKDRDAMKPRQMAMKARKSCIMKTMDADNLGKSFSGLKPLFSGAKAARRCILSIITAGEMIHAQVSRSTTGLKPDT